MKQHSARCSPAQLLGDLGQVLVDQVLEAGLQAGSHRHQDGKLRGETMTLVLAEEAVEAEAVEAWVHQAGAGLQGAGLEGAGLDGMDLEGGQAVAAQVGWRQADAELEGVEITSGLRMTPLTWWSTI